jgi:hypothetical protein
MIKLIKVGINVVFISLDSPSITPYVIYYLRGEQFGSLFQFFYHENAITQRKSSSCFVNYLGVPFDDANLLDFINSINDIEYQPNKVGFIDYNDTTGDVSITSDTWIDIPNNGLGAFSNDKYKPFGVSELLDTSTGYIDTTELSLGETILIRNDYSVKPNTNNALLRFRYVLGSGVNEYTLEKTVSRLDSGSGQFYRFSLEPDLIYMGDLNTKDNPIKLQINLSTKGTLLNAGSVIQTVKG